VGIEKSPKLPRRKVGLALGTGAARGLAHVGVLEVLEKEGIPIDMIAGTSAGAVIGALYAQGKDASQMKKLVMDLNWKRLASLVDLALPKTGFIGGRKINNLMRSVIGDMEFRDLRIPLACVATDIETGEEVVINHGSVLEGIRASVSVPVIFTIAKWEGRYLVDGGLVNPVPVSVLKRMGADFVIAVNVIPEAGERGRRRGKKPIKGGKEPNIINVIMQTVYITTNSMVKSSLEGADIVIEPQVAHIAAGEFNQAQECILQGKRAAQGCVTKIRGLLQ